jgi:hypothetical protein
MITSLLGRYVKGIHTIYDHVKTVTVDHHHEGEVVAIWNSADCMCIRILCADGIIRRVTSDITVMPLGYTPRPLR